MRWFVTGGAGFIGSNFVRLALAERPDLEIELLASQAGGGFLGGPPPGSIEDGLLFGFLTEAAADTILLPADLPIVGGQPVSVLLPGGTGNCAAGDDRDTFDGMSGWWLYPDYRAEPVPFVGD